MINLDLEIPQMAGRPWSAFESFSVSVPDYYASYVTHWVKAREPLSDTELGAARLASVDGYLWRIRSVCLHDGAVFLNLDDHDDFGPIKRLPLESIDFILDDDHVELWENPWVVYPSAQSAFEVLVKIITERRIYASPPRKAFVRGWECVVCFSDTPVPVMARVFQGMDQNSSLRHWVKWSPYGLAFSKIVLYRQFHARPVLYLSESEYNQLCEESGSQWRVVTLEMDFAQTKDLTHEREWRTLGQVDFRKLRGYERPMAIVRTQGEREELCQLFGTDHDDCPFSGVICLADRLNPAIEAGS